MAQADPVRSAVRVLIPGASAKPSTNPFRSDQQIAAGRERQLAESNCVHPYPVRFKDGADYLVLVISVFSASTTLDELAQEVRSARDIQKIEVTLLNVASDPAATSQRAVEAVVRRAA